MATKLKKNDTVVVIAGKDKGEKGRILSIDHKKSRVLVDGVNMVKRHRKASQENPQGGIVDMAAPLHISNVAYLHKGKPVRLGYITEVQTIDGKQKTIKKRIARPSGDLID